MFISLVNWIAIHIRHIKFLKVYSDDHFSISKRLDVTWYQPYQKLFPMPQATLLHLWDELGIPHKEKKQLFGNPLVIIGINVDANLLHMSLPSSAIGDLLAELD